MGRLDPAIRVEHLSFHYGKTLILDDVTLSIADGAFTVLLGRNGSGKSTLMRVMAGLEACKAGRIELSGVDLGRLSAAKRARLIGYLPQQHRPVFPFSAEDVVLTGRAGHVTLVPGKADRVKAIQAMERAGIGHLRGRTFTELSGGEQQMVMIARVLAQESRIVLLDEPTAHLDFLNQARLLSLVRDLVDSGLTVVAVLHDPNLAFLYGDHFIFLKAGRLLSTKDSQEPWDAELLRSVYDAELHVVPYGNRALVVPGKG
jgi:iron complex transport system ATP-binding protein